MTASCFVTLDRLDAAAGKTVLSGILQRTGRRLSATQEQIMLSKFTNSGEGALYLRIASTFAASWNSYTDDATARDLSDNLPSLIQNMFARIEVRHGALLVSRALALITAAASGLSELQIIELLNKDCEVLTAVFQVW